MRYDDIGVRIRDLEQARDYVYWYIDDGIEQQIKALREMLEALITDKIKELEGMDEK